MTQFLRLHARDSDFSATVLKARQFADATVGNRHKKVVRIMKPCNNEPHHVSTVTSQMQPDWKPFMQDFQKALSKALAPLQQAVSQTKANNQPPRPLTPPNSANFARSQQ